MISNFLRRNFLVTIPWKNGKYDRKIGTQLKLSTAVAADQPGQHGDRNMKSSREDSSPRPLPLSSMPGPGGLRKLPYIGTALMFKPFSKFTPEIFNKLIAHMHEKYGGVFKARTGKDYTVFTDSPQDAQTIFGADDMYPERMPMMLFQVFLERNGLPYSLGTVSGPEWKEIRSQLNPLLNRPQVCLHYLPAQNQVADDFVRRLQTIKFNPDQLSKEFFKYASESIGVVCFNRRLGFLSEDLSTSPERLQLLEAFKTVLYCIYIDLIGLERRYPKTADDLFYKKFEDSMKFVRKQSMIFVKEVMKELESRNIDRDKNPHSAASNTEMESNLLASLVVGSKLEMEKILSIIDSMLIAGTDSSARNLCILFYNLALNPQVQAKAAKEVIDLIGPEGPVDSETLAKMNYLKACVKESMRINFPLTSGTQRILTSDVILSGYSVPKGITVIMSSNISSLNPQYFPDPLKFLPERWLREANVGEKTTDKKTSAFAYLPFGHGPRSCVGRRFAEMEIYVASAKILQKLEIKVDPSYSGIDTIYKPFIAPRVPIPFIFTQRRI